MRRIVLVAAALAVLGQVSPARADVILGAFDFDSQQFGDTLIQSDGGAFAANNWLNVVNANPGSPGYLTGANFNTGVANINGVSYSIGYNTPIVNVLGADFGIVTARFSLADTIRIDVSSDAGATFSGPLAFGAAAGVATGTPCNYFYGASGGPFACNLFVTPVDLSDFGLALGASINVARVTGDPQLDLIRVAGFDDGAGPGEPVPEPTTLALLGAGLGLVARRRRQTR